ncbi:MAG: cutinase family protein [Gordonia sp. (in: high G+C Gram-positive bacteria)]|uniref:cutinase family protein n=1 Tax=Gordonia sp. (in: high G+C Gram-positive bacteria) TaxID=84139 RepID=UPI0039E5AA8D
MSRRTRRLALGVILLAIIAIVLVVILVIWLLQPAPPTPHGPPPSSTPTRPTAQPADCPDVLVLSVPGTWESSATDDPYNPHANKHALLLRVTSHLQQDFPSSRAQVHTVPYKAQFQNPTNLNDHEATYNDSRKQGYARAYGKLQNTYNHCPLTRYVLMGFSQGAVIVGDLAAGIGAGDGPIPAQDQDLVIGVGLIADGRRQSGEQHDVGPSPKGKGAEVVLGPFGSIVPGITMTGARPGGFGTLEDRVYSICAKGDLICDSPQFTNPLGAIGEFANAAQNPIHAMYATPKYWDDNGATATMWMLGWSKQLVTNSPHPKHL